MMVRLRVPFKLNKWKAIKIVFAVQCFIILSTVMRSFSNKDKGSTLERLHNIVLKELPKNRATPTEHSDMISASDITIVTGFFNIGNVKKGKHGLEHKPADYLKWMRIFGRIRNPVIAFFEDKKYMKLFRGVRVREPSYMTKIEIVKRDKVWPFPLRPKIKNLFQNASYPKHKPNTVNPDYSCVRHAKYELMAKALMRNPFNTRYYAWLDIGLFRNIADYRMDRFSLIIPPYFDKTKVAYAYNKEPAAIKDPKSIVQGNHVWTSGTFFIAKSEVMTRWVKQYRHSAEKMLNARWISGDEQVLYYMSQQERTGNRSVEVQAYKADGRVYHPYHLAYVSSSLDHCEYNRTCKV